MQPDVPLGLCPECLIKSGFPTESEPGTGEGSLGRFVPPPVEELVSLFPQFEILGFIGKGGMGAVYKARQPGLDRLVALKILPPAVANDPGFAERFNREARALARLSHPNIVVVYDFGKAGALHYLVMEFVDGTNLREVEKAGRLSAEQALAIVPQICEALQFAHNEGVVHRDIKPENLLVDKKGRVKITDFGIAKILDVSPGKAVLTGAKDVVGTPHYMAPEQIERPQTVDHRADIYSLGVVFYEMLTGELPLGKFAPPSKKVQVDVRLDEVVLHTLEKEPARRYQQASQVKTDVETIAGTPPPTGPAATAGALPPVPPSRPEPASDKILLPTFLLALFFGVFGAHRFYVGKTGTGVLQLCTLGGLGIWAVIDWILILCKVFTDKNGRRITNWWHASAKPPKPAKPPRSEAPPIISGALFGETFGGSSLMIVAPAVALMVSAFLKLFGALLVLLIGWPNTGFGHSLLSRIGMFAPFHDGPFFGAGIILFGLVPAVIMIYGAAEMIRRGSYAWAIAGSVAAILFCSTLGFPAGLWALTILLLPSVRDKFAGQHAPLTADKWIRIFGGTAAAGLLLFLMMCLFGFLQSPTHRTVTVRLPEVINDQPAESNPAAPVAPTPPAAATLPASPAPPAMPALPAIAPAPQQPPSSALQLTPPALDNRNHAIPGPRPIGDPTPAGTVSEPMAGSAVAVAPMPGSSPADVPADVAPVPVAPLDKADITNVAPAAGSRIVLLHREINAGEATDFTQTLDVGAGGKLTMNVDRGTVHITGADQNTLTIHVTRRVNGASDSEAVKILRDERLVLKQDGNEISIKAQNPSELQHSSVFDHPNLDAQYEITLPRQLEIHATTAGGDMNVSGVQAAVHIETAGGSITGSKIQGSVQATTAGGDINVSGIQGSADVETAGGRIICDDIVGNINAHTAGGDMRATECKGRLDLETAGGTITIAAFTGPGVDANTSGGSVSAHFAAAPTEDSELKSSGGNIMVELPGDAALQLEGQTAAGMASSDFPVKITDKFGNGTLSGAINGGGPVLRMETGAGNVEVRKR